MTHVEVNKAKFSSKHKQINNDVQNGHVTCPCQTLM